MAYIVDDLLRELGRLGFFDFLLPFLFAFAVIYGLLYKAKLFGEINKRISGVLAFVIGLFVAAFGGKTISVFLAELFGGTTIVLAAVISIILFVALLGFTSEDWKGKGNKGLYVAIVLGVILFIIAVSGDALLGGRNIGLFGFNTSLLAVVMIVVLIIAVVFITSGKEEGDSGAGAGSGKPAKT